MAGNFSTDSGLVMGWPPLQMGTPPKHENRIDPAWFVTFGNQYMLGLDTNGQSNAVSFSCALHCPILFESNTINVPERSPSQYQKNIEINTKANVIRKNDCLKVLLYSYLWLFLYYQTFF